MPTLQKRFSKAELNELRLTGILKVSLVALWAATAAASVASAQEPERPSQEAFIKRAVFTQQRLWLLSDSGALSSIVDGGAKRIVEHISEPVLDVCVQNGDPLIVIGHTDRGTVWTMQRWRAGEWGGGLIRIDRRCGTIRRIESNLSGDPRDGPLNTESDPVNGITTEPWKPGCVVVAIGLVHFVSHGRIVEVCGDAVKRLYFRPRVNQRSSVSGAVPMLVALR